MERFISKGLVRARAYGKFKDRVMNRAMWSWVVDGSFEFYDHPEAYKKIAHFVRKDLIEQFLNDDGN